MIYRPGAITEHQIRDVAGPVQFYVDNMLPHAPPPETLPSPGVGLRHYAPRARLILVDAPIADLPKALAAAAAPFAKARIGLMLPADLLGSHLDTSLCDAVRFSWGRWTHPGELAHNLYAGLHALDAQGCTVILCPLPQDEGVGAAIRDRLRKAAVLPPSEV